MAPRSPYSAPSGFGAEPPRRPHAAADAKDSGSDALSVSAAVAVADRTLQSSTFCILGEVSELNDKPGYKAVYFTIKDESATLPCLMWKNQYRASGVKLSLGAKIEVIGKFTIYAPQGKMNFNVKHLVLAGDGYLRQEVAARAQRLRDEGLMDPARKLPIPQLPETIGLVTSGRSAAVHDVLRTLRRRYPSARVVLASVMVEGATAARELVQGLECVANAGVDVILMVRGGGSFENLMPFNDETLARAIAACPIPVVTGIGHEPDTSIADMVADLRASNPTHAAMAVSPQPGELDETLDSLCSRMTGALTHRLRRSEIYLDGIESRPVFKDPAQLFAGDLQMVDVCQDRLERAGRALLPASADAVSGLQARLRSSLPRAAAGAQAELESCTASLRAVRSTLLADERHRLSMAEGDLENVGRTLLSPYLSQAALVTARLNDLSPLHILERGWSIALDDEGGVVRSVRDVQPDDRITLQLIDGSLACRVEQEAVSELSGLIPMEDFDD